MSSAIEAIHSLVKAFDFQKKMILLAIRLAHDTDNKAILLASLGALLNTLRSDAKTSVAAESLLLVRCIVRLLITLAKDAEDGDRCGFIFF